MRVVGVLQSPRSAGGCSCRSAAPPAPGPTPASRGRSRRTPRPRPSGAAKGRPQPAHQGGAKNVIPPQHRPHSASGSSTISPQARQRGGSTASTSPRPIRRSCVNVLAGRVAAAVIDTHDQAGGGASTRSRRIERSRCLPQGGSPIALFDRRAWRLHRERAARQGCVDFLHAEIAERLIDRLDDVGRRFRDGTRSRLASRRAVAGARRAGRGSNSSSPPSPRFGFLSQTAGLRVAADPELVPFRDAQLRPRGQRPGVALGRRSARRPDPVAPRA